MSDSQMPKSSSESQLAAARNCVFQNCKLVKHAGDQKLVLSLICPDGSEDQIALDLSDAKSVVVQVAFALCADPKPQSPDYGSRSWYNRRSVLRASTKVNNDIDRVFDEFKTDMSDMAGFIAEELQGLKRILARRGKSAARPETILARVRRALVVAVEAMRWDT